MAAMKFGVIGLGSMGKRRARDLIALGHTVTGFDIRPDRRREAEKHFGIATADTYTKMRGVGLDGCVISTPPDQHLPYYELCYKHRVPFFSEANIFVPRAEWFANNERDSGVRGYPSGTWQFYPLFGILRERLRALGRDQINTFSHQYAGYLPKWHPWESYTEFYAGQKRTSAAREMVPFEMEALTWLFGPVRAVCAVQTRAGEWQTDMDDTYLLLTEFECGVRGLCTVELHQVAPFRLLRVAARRDSFIVDISAHELRSYDADRDHWLQVVSPGVGTAKALDFEDVYRAEIACFVEALFGGSYPKTWREDRHLSNVLFAAEQSAVRRAWVTVSEAETLYDGLSW